LLFSLFVIVFLGVIWRSTHLWTLSELGEAHHSCLLVQLTWGHTPVDALQVRSSSSSSLPAGTAHLGWEGE
ncbi:hypothetical protein CLOM_g12619, partial [Closterium sp. NIES-68]